jgi:hypothetical protein
MKIKKIYRRSKGMGLLPMDADILPPSDDRVFKLILTSPTAKPVLADLVSAVIMPAIYSFRRILPRTLTNRRFYHE